MLYRDYLKDKYQNTAVKLANAEGVPCVLEYTKGKNIRNYEVYGNSVQDGTPTPESPVEIQSVGDLTKNLLPYPYSDTTKTINGVTFTDNGDGSITANGTATADTRFYCRSSSDKITISPGTYTMSGCPDGGSSTTYYIGGFAYNAFSSGQTFSVTNTTSDWFYIMIKSGATADNLVFKPQLEEGSTATEYEPYGYKIPIVNSGKNLIPYPYSQTTKTENGITFTDNGDGSVTVSGTATEYVAFNFVQALPCRPNQAYTIVKNGVDVNNVSFVFCDVNENGKITRETVSTTREKTFTVTTLASTAYIKLLMKRQNNAKCTGTVKPTLELGETATEYEPYRVPVTANIYLDEPLRKIGDYADYIDFKGQRVVRRVGVLDNTSTKPISESLVALAIPTEEPIPLPALKTFKGTNIISVDTSVQPSNIKAKYVRL